MATSRRTLLLIALTVLCLALFGSWFNDSKIPEPIPEQFKVKVIDACIRAFTLVAKLLISTGVTYPYSPLLRTLADRWILLQVTGNPWWTYSGDDLIVSTRTIAGVRVRMYEPTLTIYDRKRPVFVYLHGGAWTWLSAEVYEPFTSRIAEEGQFVVISVNYRLAPQVVFPEPRSDCAAVLTYLFQHGGDLGIDVNRIAVGGDSAGGNLAASLSLEFKKQLKSVVLLVPALQPVNSLTASAVENELYLQHSIHSRETYVVYLIYGGLDVTIYPELLNNSHVSPEVKQQLYASKVSPALVPSEHIRRTELRSRSPDTTSGNPHSWSKVKDVFLNPHFSPLLAEDEMLKGLPPSFVGVAGYDIIRDDGLMFYTRIKALANKVVLKNCLDGIHNSLMFHSGPLKLGAGERFLKDVVAFLKYNL